jgi:tetratricopeptide (TPR) repeat protein
MSFLLLFTLAQAPSAYTQAEVQALFTEANDAFYRQDYRQAQEKYERLIKADAQGPDILFNLGTAYLAAGDLGPAVLWLERARALKHDDDIEANLAIARQRQGDQVVGADAEGPFLERIAAAIDESLITPAFLGTWVVFFAALVAFRRSTSRRRLGLGLLLAGSGATAVTLGAGVATHAWVHLRVAEAVVQRATIQVRTFPGESASVAFEAHAGLKVRVLEESGRYTRIRLANALEGWTEKDGLELL